jgi:hypothetical protein
MNVMMRENGLIMQQQQVSLIIHAPSSAHDCRASEEIKLIAEICLHLQLRSPKSRRIIDGPDDAAATAVPIVSAATENIRPKLSHGAGATHAAAAAAVDQYFNDGSC